LIIIGAIRLALFGNYMVKQLHALLHYYYYKDLVW